MATLELTPPDFPEPIDLIAQLRFVILQVRSRLHSADLQSLSRAIGVSYSNLCRLKAGGEPSLQTLELLAYYFSPKPEPKKLTLQECNRLQLQLRTIQAKEAAQ